MTKIVDRTMIISSLCCLLPMIAGFIWYEQLPAELATHFNFDNQPNGYTSKNFALFGIPACMALLNMFVHFMLNNDPKKANFSKKLTRWAKWFVPLLTALVMYVTIAFNLGYTLNVATIIIPVVAVIIMVFGNYLPKCKQNYSMGIRISWTLNDEEIWDKTHRVAGKLWLGGGFLMLMISLSNKIFALILFWGIFAVITLVPLVYAYLLYRSKNQQSA